MNPALTQQKTASAGRRGRWQLILILLVVIGPMLLATAMYQWRFWVPDSRSYHGELLGNGLSRADLGVQGAVETRWQLLVTAPQDCAADCQELVYLARQLQIGLNRDAARASHALAVARPLLPAYDQQLQREYPQLGRYRLDLNAYGKTAGNAAVPQLWIVDPHGNLVLRYDATVKGKAVLNDLRHLLKLSQIG
ncbi:MAG: hypothetical protein ACOH2I_02670 [Pseudomonas sp.]